MDFKKCGNSSLQSKHRLAVAENLDFELRKQNCRMLEMSGSYCFARVDHND